MNNIFEQIAKEKGYDITPTLYSDDERGVIVEPYVSQRTSDLWEGYQAALQSKAVTSEDELMEVIAHAVYAHSPKAVNLAIAKKQAVAATKAILTQFNVTKKE